MSARPSKPTHMYQPRLNRPVLLILVIHATKDCSDCFLWMPSIVELSVLPRELNIDREPAYLRLAILFDDTQYLLAFGIFGINKIQHRTLLINRC